jgi:hypothetical protein
MRDNKHYYPTYTLGCNPLHEVRDWARVRKLIRDAQNGDIIPPIIVDTLRGGNMLTGTHRAAANDIMQMLHERNGRDYKMIPVREIGDMAIPDEVDGREIQSYLHEQLGIQAD